MFVTKNEYVSYPGHGLGRVIESKTMNGVEFISIEILANGLKIMIPKASEGVYRPLMDKTTANKVKALMQIPNDFEAASPAKSWKRRLDLFLTKVKSNNPVLMAEVVAELNNRKLDGEISFGERQLLDSVKTLLQTELDLIK